MAPRSDRRNRKGVSSKGAQGDAVFDAPLSPRESGKLPVEEEEVEEVRAATQGISILKEIFPDHDVETNSTAVPSKEGLPLQNILGSVPSPARAPFGQQHHAMSFGPPAHSSMPMVGPVGPPPPPLMPAPVCQDPWEGHRATGPLLGEPALGNYRERLRAGGRGAFQRAIDAGLVPKNMKQDWGAVHPQGMLSNAADIHSGGNMSYGCGDSQQMWGGAGHMGADYCGVHMQQQYSQDYCGMQMQAAPTPELQHMTSMANQQGAPQMPMQTSLMLPQMAVQQPMQQQMPLLPMQGDQSPMQMGQMSMPVTPMGVPQMPSTASGDVTPVQRECMAILMPQTTQVSPDMQILAAQLRASAECQRYED